MDRLTKSKNSQTPMLNITIIAAGKDYQNAAAWAAPTYVQNLSQPGVVDVLLSDQEKPLDILKEHSERFGFTIKTFPFAPQENVKYLMQLKCQAMHYAVSHLKPDELLFLADADTCCCRALTLDEWVQAEMFAGKIGLVPDLRDRHNDNLQEPWYLPRHKRDTYVNAGVILTAVYALDMFKLFLDFSKRTEFSNPPFGDQAIINFVLGEHHRGRLLLLSGDYNEMRRDLSITTKFIAHFPGGKRLRVLSSRLASHQKLCMQILSTLHDH
jgi:hypothetical protein